MPYSDCYEAKSVNLKLARLTNPTVALYFAALLDSRKISAEKGKVDQSGFWKPERPKIEAETGISTEEQKNCDSILAALKMLSKGDGSISLDLRKATEVIAGSTEAETAAISTNVRSTFSERKLAKAMAVKERIACLWKPTMTFTDPEHLPIIKLINVYYDKGMTKEEQWQIVFDQIHARVSSLGELKEVVDYVISTNYASIPAALDSFDRRSPTARRQGTSSLGAQKISNGDLYAMEF